MINILQDENLLEIEILEGAGIEDASALKNEIENGINNKKEINITLKDNKPIHISLCVVIFIAALEAGKKNLVLNVSDKLNSLEDTFKNLGLKKEYGDILKKLKDRG